MWPVRDWADLLLLKAAAIPELLDNARINVLSSFRGWDRLSPGQCTDHGGSFAGKLCIVTGANAGVGFDTSAALARRGATVLMACRSAERGEAAVQRVRESLQHCETTQASHHSGSSRGDGGVSNTHGRQGTKASAGSVEFRQLDLSRLSSVRNFVRQCPRQPDLLVCNAGLMAPEQRLETPDGLEQQFQVNYLGHWLLARELLLSRPDQQESRMFLPRPVQSRSQGGTRLLMVTSLTHRGGRINFDDLQARRRYIPLRSYCDSKLAIVMAVRSFQQRFDSAGSQHTAVAVDPGVLDTALARNYFRTEVPRPLRGLLRPIVEMLLPWILLPPATAASTMLWAATAPPEQVAGRFVKNKAVLRASRRVYDGVAAERLWRVSCELAGVADD